MEFFIYDTYFIVSPIGFATAATLLIAIVVTPLFFFLIRRERQDRED